MIEQILNEIYDENKIVFKVEHLIENKYKITR